MSVYDDLKIVAEEILGDPEFKQGIIEYVKITSGNGTADNPGASTQSKISLNAVVTGVNYKYVMSSQALASDKTVICAIVDGLTPSGKDFIDIDGERFKIHMDISPPAAGVRPVWKFIVRKG